MGSRVKATLVGTAQMGSLGLTLAELYEFVTAARSTGAPHDSLVLSSEYRDGKPELIALIQVEIPNPQTDRFGTPVELQD